MEKSRYTSFTYALMPQRVPGQREIRFRPARVTQGKRPKEVERHV